MKELLTGLLLWIGQNTGMVYDVNDGLPQVKQVESRELAALMFKGGVPAYISPADLRRMTEQVEATYRPDTRTIYVRRGVDLASVHGRGALVHELVHFIQYQNGMHRKVVCTKALEADAYRAQAVYLKQHGAEPAFDELTIIGRSMC
jgi:hypothetical protein